MRPKHGHTMVAEVIHYGWFCWLQMSGQEYRRHWPNKWLERTPPSVTPPARRETQASCHPAATPLSDTVGR
jgi:hypothetical protein